MRDQDERDSDRTSGGGTAPPGPGEKACPYCAETIKAAAIRCRWCRADLTETAASGPRGEPRPALGDAPEDAPEDVPADDVGPGVDTERADAEPKAPAGSGRLGAALASRRTTAVLGVLTLVAAVLVVRMVLAAQDDPAVADGNTPLAAGAAIDTEGAKSAGLSAATEAVETILGYRHDQLEQDLDAARAVLDGDMRAEYDETMGAIEEETRRNKAVVEATVVAASAISATEHDVRALLFVNTTTEGKHLEQPRIDLNRVVVSLHRDGGDWVVTDLDAL